MNRIAAAQLEHAYRYACETELRAFKPGNVSLYSEAHDMTVADFRESAKASAPHLVDFEVGVGERIYRAVAATRERVGCNTNLGIVLLAAPLLQACIARGNNESLRESVDRVLAATTRNDAEWVYRAIRLAAPGGLGEAPEQDVRQPPDVTLQQAMALAERRDRIAWQYAHGYADIFDFSVPVYHTALSRWGDDKWATVGLFAELLRWIPDSHIERKFGVRFTPRVADRMRLVSQALSMADHPEQTMELLRDIDNEFKSAGINPGTTADLTVTTLLAVKLDTLCEH
ncbi:MAG: triphosphoribosyl-dephospho-CoA synthase [Methylococcaceae bacterium]|nr:triphosphoribosyl-dephospho-CoA synthase [Methylococcaceae bacterium]